MKFKIFSDVYPPSFIRLCLGALLFFLSFNIVLPELSTMLNELNGYDYLGWIIPAFSISALVARPLSGWLTDNVGRRWTMIAGCVFCIVAGFFYPFVSSVGGFLLVRIIHGFSTGFTPTGFTAFTSDVIPASHRGRAMGWQGVFNNAGTSLGYGLGAVIALKFGRDAMFLTSSALAVFALMLFYSLPETKPAESKRKFEFSWKNLIYIPALSPGIIMWIVCISLGTILTVMPDYTLSLGYENKGLYLSWYIGFSLLFRLVSGKISDALGRAWSTAIGTFLQILAMFALVKGGSSFYFFASAILYGIGQGFNAPSLFAWAGDVAGPENRGKSLATLFIFLELGIITGGLLAGAMITRWQQSYENIFLINGLSFVVAFGLSVYFIFKGRFQKSQY